MGERPQSSHHLASIEMRYMRSWAAGLLANRMLWLQALGGWNKCSAAYDQSEVAEGGTEWREEVKSEQEGVVLNLRVCVVQNLVGGKMVGEGVGIELGAAGDEVVRLAVAAAAAEQQHRKGPVPPVENNLAMRLAGGTVVL